MRRGPAGDGGDSGGDGGMHRPSPAETIVFDPTRDEVAVADGLLAVSVAPRAADPTRRLRLVAMRTLDAPARLSAAGIPDAVNPAAGGVTEATAAAVAADADRVRAAKQTAEKAVAAGAVWTPLRGGIAPDTVARVLDDATRPAGVGHDVLQGLAKFAAAA